MGLIGDWWRRFTGITSTTAAVTVTEGEKVDTDSGPSLKKDMLKLVAQCTDNPQALDATIREALSEISADDSSSESIARNLLKLEMLHRAGLISKAAFAELRRKIFESG